MLDLQSQIALQTAGRLASRGAFFHAHRDFTEAAHALLGKSAGIGHPAQGREAFPRPQARHWASTCGASFLSILPLPPRNLSTATAAFRPDAMALITEAVPETASPAANTPSRLVERVNGSSVDETAIGEVEAEPLGYVRTLADGEDDRVGLYHVLRAVDDLDLRDVVLVEAEDLDVEELDAGHPRRRRSSIRVEVCDGRDDDALLFALLDLVGARRHLLSALQTGR